MTSAIANNCYHYLHYTTIVYAAMHEVGFIIGIIIPTKKLMIQYQT